MPPTLYTYPMYYNFLAKATHKQITKQCQPPWLKQPPGERENKNAAVRGLRERHDRRCANSMRSTAPR